MGRILLFNLMASCKRLMIENLLGSIITAFKTSNLGMHYLNQLQCMMLYTSLHHQITKSTYMFVFHYVHRSVGIPSI